MHFKFAAVVDEPVKALVEVPDFFDDGDGDKEGGLTIRIWLMSAACVGKQVSCVFSMHLLIASVVQLLKALPAWGILQRPSIPLFFTSNSLLLDPV